MTPKEYIGEERRSQDSGWHLRKEIHIGHILTTVGFILAAFSAWSNLDKRIERESLVNEYQDRVMVEHLKTTDKTFSGLSDDVKEIRKLLMEEYKSRREK